MKLDLNQALEQLAQAFNTTVDKIYPMLIKQAYVTGVSNLIGIFIAWVVLAVVMIIFKKHGIRKEKHFGLTDGTVVLIVVTALVSVATIVVTTTVGYEAITALLNPEYWALKEVLTYVK